jgi:hypothetical protein
MAERRPIGPGLIEIGWEFGGNSGIGPDWGITKVRIGTLGERRAKRAGVIEGERANKRINNCWRIPNSDCTKRGRSS